MAFQGERFTIDLSDDDYDDNDPDAPPVFSPPFAPADITERPAAAPGAAGAAAAAPRPPAPSSSATGFPEHRKRTAKSAFKRRREEAARANQPTTTTTTTTTTTEGTATEGTATSPLNDEEKRSIDEENTRRLAAMSSGELAGERDELVSSLPPSLLERFLRRATVDQDHSFDNDKDETPEKHNPIEQELSEVGEGGQTTTYQQQQQQQQQQQEQQQQQQQLDDRPPAEPPADLFPASQPPTAPIHFPKPPPRNAPVPDLDPSSPSFLADLQSHYFPDTPHNPSALSWMDPTATDKEDQDQDPTTLSAYHAQSTTESLTPSAIRFSLTATILGPRTSLSLPTTLGLHHHGADPEAAGYTIPELAILGRSSVPAQRCLAWRVVGRLLYRLGRGEFGSRGSPLVDGLWNSVERERVVATMLAEACDGDDDGDDHGTTGNNREKDNNNNTSGQTKAKAAGGVGKHASAKAWATEAVWLWRRGGGGDRGLLKDGEVRST